MSHPCDPLWAHEFDPATGRGASFEICTCRDRALANGPVEPENPEAEIDPGEIDAAADDYEREIDRRWGD